MIDNSKLIEYNFYGFIPGPREETSIFFKRVELAQTGKDFHKGITLVQSLFDVYPSWVRIESTDQLHLWEAAATYIEANQGVFTPIVQVKRKGIPFWFSQEEIVAHELVHAIRVAFAENFFEEILAYKTSYNRLRRYFGPIFFRPIEVVVFLFLLIGVWLYQLICLFLFDSISCLTLWVPFTIVGLLVIRLVIAQSIFSLCLKKLRKFLRQPDKALSLTLRLGDKEIIYFAFKSLDKVRKYVLKAQKTSLRWYMLTLVYHF